MVISQVTLLAGDRRCRTIVETTMRANGISNMPTATTVPAIANAKDQGEPNIYVVPPKMGRHRQAARAIEIGYSPAASLVPGITHG